jgi:flavin reductase (DIM6/NTAB) family NADH-FMN oxidoreductase RutF
MAASWVSPFSEEPPRITAAVEKESLTGELIRGAGLFTVNVLSVDHVDFIYGAGTVSGREADKARLLGAEFSRDTVTGAPRLSKPEPMGVLEARVYRVYTDLAEDVDLVVADVVAVHVDPSLYSERYGWDLRRARVAMHAAGRAFTTASGLYLAGRRGGKSGQV